jgi:hypothetical protein
LEKNVVRRLLQEEDKDYIKQEMICVKNNNYKLFGKECRKKTFTGRRQGLYKARNDLC